MLADLEGTSNERHAELGDHAPSSATMRHGRPPPSPSMVPRAAPPSWS